MENWFRDVGKTILAEALGDACDRANSSFKTDFQSYTQERLTLTAELETLRPIALQVQRLEDENAALKDEINTLKNANREKTDASSNTSHGEAQSTLQTPLAPRSANQVSSEWTNAVDIEAVALPELKTEFLRMGKNLAKLHDKYLDLQAALHKSNELVRERTATYRNWVDHAKQLNEQSLKRSRKIKKLEAKLAEISQEPLNLSFSSDVGEVEVPAEPATLTAIHSHQPRQSNEPKEAGTAHQRRALAHIEDNRTARSSSLSRKILESVRSGLTLETDHSRNTSETPPCLPPLPPYREFTEGKLHIKPEPSSDTPVIVSERCVRKRKNADDGEGGILNSARVKVEHSPQPQSTDERHPFAPHDSIDFDTEYRIVETPRKNARYQHAHSVRLDDETGVQGRAHRTRITHPTNDPKYDGRIPTNDISSTDLAAADSAELQVKPGPALQPRNNNQVLKPRLNLSSGSRNRKSSSRPRGITSLAEDSYQDENLDPSNSKSVPKASALEQLLDTPSPARDDIAVRSNYPAGNEQFSNNCFQPSKRQLPFGEDERQSLGSTPKEKPNDSSDKPAMNRDHDKSTAINRAERRKAEAPPLRQMPKASLRLDDFKINPQANEGYDYAFTDVVRRKDDRACLQGCVKENCCGHKFRALAHVYRAGTRPYEFQALLESYLGDDFHRLSTMSDNEKEALWVEAKIRELANTTGKHRHRFARMSTPPGFWRADFPSTQEGEEYSEEAAKLEREIIEERYREAMRPGGSWIFRDE
ncbi:DNA repair protein endonuclease SAE2/CtIP C-terminus-domain-containing protein [Xylaria telfairii]|nr:DNA repair protein endonuclease SAE2/CtIP C-terminus-domain-containing protein [Xylaria telfairii]